MVDSFSQAVEDMADQIVALEEEEYYSDLEPFSAYATRTKKKIIEEAHQHPFQRRYGK